MCVSPVDRTSAAALRHLDHPQLCCPISGPHSLLLEGASSTWQEGCGQRSSLFQALEPQRKDFLSTYHIHMPGQVSDWPGSGHMFTPGPIPLARGWAAVIGSTAPTPRTTRLRGREGPRSAEQRKGVTGRVLGPPQQLICANHCAKYLFKIFSQSHPEAEADSILPQ